MKKFLSGLIAPDGFCYRSVRILGSVALLLGLALGIVSLYSIVSNAPVSYDVIKSFLALFGAVAALVLLIFLLGFISSIAGEM